MKKILSILILALVVTFSFASGNDKPTRVAILYFDNSGDAALEKLKKGLADMLITDLSTVKTLSLVERDRLEEILKEQKMSNSKSFDAATASKIGKLLGAEIILTGGFFEMMGTFRVDARIIDVETGKILKSDGVEGETKSFFSLEKELVKKILTNLDVKLSEDETTGFNKSGKEQEISYQAAKIYSKALDAIDKGNHQEASEILNVVLMENEGFAPARKESIKINNMLAKDSVENKMRGTGDPLKGLNVSKGTAPIGTGKYYALLIGIDKYSGTWPTLNTAVNDAKKIESVLTAKYKFDKFITLYNGEATRAAIFDKFEWLVENISENDNVLVYFSGHGEFKASLKKGYWIPVDAASSSTSSYISNNDIQTFLAAIKSKHTLMISDACFSGDIFRGNTISVPFEQSEKYYKQVYNLNSRKAISSGGIEP
ncbi:MAG: caspase family protein [Bacteroidetes bacterium]|nr:caspase family protein [Bacteroidota bacterium]